MRTSVLLLLIACGTSGSNPPDFGPEDATAVGSVLGAPATATIGAAGGSVTSPDGTLVISVPAGAVASDTAFSITPIQSTSPVAVPEAYRLAPSDVTFAQPVTLVFTPPTATTETLLFMAQDELGYWHARVDASSASMQGIASVAVTSFDVAPPPGVSARVAPADGPPARDWTAGKAAVLTPSSATVRVGTQAHFSVATCFNLDANGNALDDSVVRTQCAAAPSGAQFAWFLNGDLGGNQLIGTVSGNADATYSAPKNLWDLPVTLEADITLDHKQLYALGTIMITCANAGLRATGVCKPETWTGSSHITGPDGGVYDSNWVFGLDNTQTPPQWVVQSGQVNITKQPPPSGGCTITIEASHAIGPMDGRLQVDETDFNNPIIQGQGITVWLATYTVACANGTNTTQMPYSIAWWPLPPTGAPMEVAPGGMATFSVDGGGSSGTVMMARNL